MPRGCQYWGFFFHLFLSKNLFYGPVYCCFILHFNVCPVLHGFLPSVAHEAWIGVVFLRI